MMMPPVTVSDPNHSAERTERALAIRQAAVSLAGELGLAGITMKRVASLAGMTPGNLYLYYKSKEELIQATYLDLKAKAVTAYISGLDATQPFQALLKQLWDNIFGYQLRNPQEVVFTNQCLQSAFVPREMLEKGEVMLAPILSILERGKHEGMFRDLPTRVIGIMLWGVIAESAKSCLALSPEEQARHSDLAFEFCWRGLQP